MKGKVRQLRDDEADPKASRPGDEPSDHGPELLAAKQLAAEIFVRLFADCIPKRVAYRGRRRWKAGYNRMVVVAYVVAPELFMGMDQEEAAQTLEIDVTQFRRLQRDVEAQIAARRGATQRRP